MKLLLVCSPGGHLQQMMALESAWSGGERSWVTLPSAEVAAVLVDEDVDFAHGPTNRSLGNLLRNAVLAWRLLRTRRPDAILSTGAGVAVPFFVVGALLGIRRVYVESLTRTESISLTGRLVYPFANRFFAQWPAAAKRLRRAEYAGSVL